MVVAPSKLSWLPTERCYLAFRQMDAKETLTDYRGTVNKPVAVLSLTLVRANRAGIDHCDCITSVEGHGRVGRGQREVRGVRNLCRIVQSQTCEELALEILTIF